MRSFGNLAILLSVLVSGEASALERCPDPAVCRELESLRRACEEDRGRCGEFVARFRRMLEPCDCSTPDGTPCLQPRLWACGGVKSSTPPNADVMWASLKTLAHHEDDDARSVFASDELRAVLTGEYADEFRKRSLDAEREMAAGDDTARRGPAWRLPSGLFSASASSAKSSHAADKAVDAKAFTAWCEGAPGDGAGEWLTIRSALPPGQPWPWPICGLRIVPGFALTQRTYDRNGRVTKLRIERCDSGREAIEAVLRTPTDVSAAFVDVRLSSGLLRELREGCIRLTVVEAVPGTTGDTCIAEVGPMVNCR